MPLLAIAFDGNRLLWKGDVGPSNKPVTVEDFVFIDEAADAGIVQKLAHQAVELAVW